MDDAVEFVHFIQKICNINVDSDRKNILSFLLTFISIKGKIDDEIDKFITTVYGKNSGRELDQRIYITVGTIMHLKALRSELDDRKSATPYCM